MSKNKRKNFVERKGLEKIYYPTAYNSYLNMSQDEKNANRVYVYKDKIEVYYAFHTGDSLGTSTLLIRYLQIAELPGSVQGNYLVGDNASYVRIANMLNYACLQVAPIEYLATNTLYTGMYTIPRI